MNYNRVAEGKTTTGFQTYIDFFSGLRHESSKRLRILRKCEKLKQYDERLSDTYKELFEKMNGSILRDCHKRLTGSARDGTSTARLFSNDHRFHLEWDVEYDFFCGRPKYLNSRSNGT